MTTQKRKAVLFHSLYKCEDGICYEHGEGFDDLKHNAIVNSFAEWNKKYGVYPITEK